LAVAEIERVTSEMTTMDIFLVGIFPMLHWVFLLNLTHRDAPHKATKNPAEAGFLGSFGKLSRFTR